MSILLPREKKPRTRHKYKEASIAVGSPSPFTKKGRGGGGLLCMYYGCENEAKHICPYCYLLFCDEHKEPRNHQCNPLHRELSKLKNIPDLNIGLQNLVKN